MANYDTLDNIILSSSKKTYNLTKGDSAFKPVSAKNIICSINGLIQSGNFTVTGSTITFTGATASIRGSDGYSAFAGAKHAKRSLAQSMARELGPKGIHVAHVVIDGAIDTPWIKELFNDFYNEKKDQDGLMNTDDIAKNYLWLYKQPRNAWTHEIDLRPWIEKW